MPDRVVKVVNHGIAILPVVAVASAERDLGVRRPIKRRVKVP